VTDSGKGIPVSEQSRIFEEFYQLDNPGRDRNKGVGLGLAIVQRLCELSHARISVRSEVGVGTCFSVRLAEVLLTPATLVEPEHWRPTPAPALALGGRRIYVIDDEMDILKSMTRLLELWGGQARSAHSPASAVQLFEQHGKPDLLITDLRLGADENGAELTLRLRQRFGEFPALVTTGEISHEALGFASNHGLQLLHKPITEEALRRAMSQLLAGADAVTATLESSPSATSAALH
jgi:CheY-like chemotaxis protein